MANPPERQITARITVDQQGDGVFRVTVDEGGSRSSHTVRLSAADWQKLTGGAASEKQLILYSFQFLLEREPKESILGEFDLTVISRYFPEYEQAMRRRIPR